MSKENIERKKVKLVTEFKDNTGKNIVIEIAGGIFDRAQEKLRSLDLTPKRVALGLIFLGSATGAGYLVKRKLTKRIETGELEKLNLTNDQFKKFTVTAENHRDQIYKFFSFRLRDTQKADEFTQITFERALRSYSKFIPNNKLKNPELTWLYAIASNLLKNFYRDSKSKDKRTAFSIDSTDFQVRYLPSEIFKQDNFDFEISEQVKYIRDVIPILDDEDILIAYFKQIDGLTNSDIGYILGRTEGAIKSKYYRLCKTIEDIFKSNAR